MNRRLFLISSLSALAGSPGISHLHAAIPDAPVSGDRIHGLLVGSMIGDALGGPVEFQDPDKIRTLTSPPHAWKHGEWLDDAALEAAAARLQLRSYEPLRPEPQPYAHWTRNARPGSITDDSRHKLILLEALRTCASGDQWPLDRIGYARAHLDWPRHHGKPLSGEFQSLRDAWLQEWEQAARWVIGDRDPKQSLPPQRMWGGLPTCSGQMALLPLAALFPGKPSRAYRAAYHLAFFDNGFGLDLNAALVAGLATTLALSPASTPDPQTWNSIFDSMRSTDPHGYGRVPWVKRPMDRWLDLALQRAEEARRQPAALFETLEQEFRSTIKWEAQVPFVVAFACLALCRFHPLAALQLSIEWGHDTDSYAQIVGAFVGALHGASVFPESLIQPVENRLKADYDVDLRAEADLLARWSESGRNRKLVSMD